MLVLLLADFDVTAAAAAAVAVVATAGSSFVLSLMFLLLCTVLDLILKESTQRKSHLFAHSKDLQGVPGWMFSLVCIGCNRKRNERNEGKKKRKVKVNLGSTFSLFL